MSFLDIQTALDTKLSSTPGLENIAVAWEGTDYEPTLGTVFIRPTNLPVTSDQLDLSNSVQNNSGIYQIDVFFPATGRGTGQMLEILSNLFNHFKEDLKLESGSSSVHIRSVSRLPQATADENTWLIGGIQINYTSFF